MKAVLYCNKKKPLLGKGLDHYILVDKKEKEFKKLFPDIYSYIVDGSVNGKIVAEIEYEVRPLFAIFCAVKEECEEHLKGSCMTRDELYKYAKGKDRVNKYIIEDIRIFERPLLNSDERITKKISCSPEELCRILNGLQTVIIRKR